MVSSQYFTVLDRVSYSCTIKRSWLSLWLGLAVSIFQFWIIHRTVRKKDTMAPVIVRVIREYFVALVMVRVSSQYRDCIPYNYPRRMSWLLLGL